MEITKLSQAPAQELLKLYADILGELIQKKICTTYNSPIGDYTEWLVCNSLTLKRQPNSEKGVDAIDITDNVRYQIKGRWLHSPKTPRELGVIRDLDKNAFDFLIGVLFDAHFTVFEAYKIPHRAVKENSYFASHVRGSLVYLRPPITVAEGVERIDDRIRSYLSSLVCKCGHMAASHLTINRVTEWKQNCSECGEKSPRDSQIGISESRALKI